MIFIRHPRTSAPPGLCYGRLQVEVAPDAPDQIARAMDTVPPFAAVVSSPAERCRMLAQGLSARDSAPLIFDDRLRELDFGSWEGLMWQDIPRAESDPWAADPWTIAPPGGETFATLHARVAAATAEVKPETLVVCHAGVIRAAQMILLGHSFQQVFAAPVPYAEPIHMVPETV